MKDIVVRALGFMPSSLFRHLGVSDWSERHMPARLRKLVDAEEEASEQLIGWVQLVLASTFLALYLIAPRPSDAEIVTMFQPVPTVIGGYIAFTIVRIVAARLHYLPGWFLVLSMIIDVVLLYALIWMFHKQYAQPPAFYLKIPTFIYIFVFIAIRALRFDPRFVLSQGLFAALGWVLMVVYAVNYSGTDVITRSFTEYLTSNAILIGAEFDKVFAILMVTTVLSIALWRARVTLMTAVREGAATRDMRRFLSKGVAEAITSSETEAIAGMAEDREAAILMLDIRGFTPFANSVEPRVVLEVLKIYHSLAVPIIQEHNGVIDKFLGDGVMGTFGAVSPSTTAERDALRTLEDILGGLDEWDCELVRLGCRPLAINAAVASGRIVFATIGNEQRLEYTVIGDPANLASKLEKHNKAQRTVALAPRATFERAVEQGYAPALAFDVLEGCRVAGTEEAIDLVAFRRPDRGAVAA